jgi:hypothetical protein
MSIDFNELFSDYDFLIPNKIEGYIIIRLWQKIKSHEIQEEFSYSDIRNVIDETASFTNGSTPQTEKILKDLLHYFIKKPPETISKYYLSDYAERFIQLLETKIQSPYRNFPLKKNFEKYFSVEFEKIEDFEELNRWFIQGFHDTSKRVVIDHIESLQDEIESSIKKLNEILYSEKLQAIEMVKLFVNEFKNFGLKAEQIREALFLKNETLRSLKNTSDFFYSKIEETKHFQTIEEEKQYQELEYKWQTANQIKEEVTAFFENIDKKLLRITNQIVFASSKLKELEENFQYQSLFKINLKKLLQLVLETSSFDKNEGILLNKNFPIKGIPFEKIQLFFSPKYEFNIETGSIGIVPQTNTDYEQAERTKIQNALQVQEKIASWVDICFARIEKENELNYSSVFYEILNSEQNIEIPLQVGFSLFQQFSNNKDFHVIIDKTIANPNRNDIIIWNMKINRKEILIHS